ncbi:MAG: DEAD/DEAH box helicase [Gammaproteobacteria bacterium]|nr:DEAD/DEAH box helicase [Gammaproteobacteria bacterium]
MTDSTPLLFPDLGLSAPVLSALKRIGYEQPTPIQAQSIPPLLDGQDLLGTAQTGTGKTAAFALPLLSTLDVGSTDPQVLVLTPTRELAIQVAEAFQTYASAIKRFHVLPIYGGQSMGIQLRQLSRGAQVIVGTPGRVMDHLRRGTLKLDALKTVVLDEADEMLRMGFIDDVQWILDHTPPERQVALFSATMPAAIRKVADKYLKSPVRIQIESKTSTVESIEQKYWVVSGTDKLDALTRILEVEEFDGIIIFVRTKTSSVELADRLEARGHSAAAINGDMTQAMRESTIAKLKNGKLDILVATDVAARGIDVARVSHVINYDIPSDTEAYVHRIGRTARAGRAGTAILFVAPRERRLLGAIEKATRQKMTALELPSREQVNRKRVEQFKVGITEVLAAGELELFEALVDEYVQEHGTDTRKLAAALALLAQKELPIFVRDVPGRKPSSRDASGSEPEWGWAKAESKTAPSRKTPARSSDSSTPAASLSREPRPTRAASRVSASEVAREVGSDEVVLESYRLAVGHDHKVTPGDIVGAIANEAGLQSKYIGRIRLFDTYSTVELPGDMPKEIYQLLKKVRVRNVALGIEKATAGPPKRSSSGPPAKPRKKPVGTLKRKT